MISILGALLKKLTIIYLKNLSLDQKYDNVKLGVGDWVGFTKGFIQHA